MINSDKLKIFLFCVDQSFPTPLSQKQDLNSLAEKFMDKADLCYAEENGKILALVAGYTENAVNDMAYISVVATLPEARGRGLASKLVTEFICRAEAKHLKAVHLYTDQANIGAIKMYKKLGFIEWKCEDEARPDDLHLIYLIEKEKI